MALLLLRLGSADLVISSRSLIGARLPPRALLLIAEPGLGIPLSYCWRMDGREDYLAILELLLAASDEA